jgi:hypothetical protein
VGSAQRLSNGNYYFTSGFLGNAPNRFGREIEIRPDGTQVYTVETGRLNQTMYRSFRMRTLYEGIDDALAGNLQKVENVAINDGSVQRSMVNRITVTFGGAAILDPGAIELRRQNGTPVNFQLAVSVTGGKTVAVLTFAGAEFIGGSLADGNYQLRIRADRIHDRYGRELDGDADGTAGGDGNATFHRLFGDSDGDRDVDLIDAVRFLSTLGRQEGNSHYLWYFDFNGDDRVGLLDTVAFGIRLGTHLNP